MQDAFVQVLLERGYAKTTVREVAAVAGVAVGSFYEYFGNMQALAALCISRIVKTAASKARQAIESRRGRPLVEVVDAMLDCQVRNVMSDAQSWAALFLLERQVSTPEAFRHHYAAWISLWCDTLAAASDAPSQKRLATTARMAHAITYGWISQSLITIGPLADETVLREELGLAVQAYLTSACRSLGDSPGT